MYQSVLMRWPYGVLIIACLLAACARSNSSIESTPTAITIFLNPLPPATPTFEKDAYSDIPDEARVATHQGDPRLPAYWEQWNSCAEVNQAAVASANGGREAGWILMDDLITDPGIQIGDFRIPTCEAGLNLLQSRAATGKESDDPIYDLASALLAAELNLNAGSETCPIAEEVDLGGHLVLSEAGFNGEGKYQDRLTEKMASAIPRLVELLTAYNSGQLCR